MKLATTSLVHYSSQFDPLFRQQQKGRRKRNHFNRIIIVLSRGKSTPKLRSMQ